MWFPLKSALALAVLAAMAAAVRAQAPASPPPDGPRYVVTYIEVKPTTAVEAQKLLRAFRDTTRKEAGNLRAEALQRIGQINHFVLLEAWKDQAAIDAHFKAQTTAEFRDKIKAIQNAPIDDRVHFPLSVGPVELKATAAAVAVVTHVDVIPPQRENGTAFTKQLAEESRKEAGNMRLEALTQVNRQNHFTVIEVWRDRNAADVHSMAEHTRVFRDKLAPAAGALYDERFYRFMD
ncbi:MAG: antibiotic biosynthesis monooxygenase [Hyphomicrobiaceae bacterium]|nr:antibiotic biosynthesis monooxygenase [Hyphomicrobiaceae bacterium]